jgi:DNA-binding NarL/FixJ family response regulator
VLSRTRPASHCRARVAVVGADSLPGATGVLDALSGQPDVEVIADTPGGPATGRDRLALLERARPDVVLLGRLPGRPELAGHVAGTVRDTSGEPSRVLALSVGPPDAELRAVLRAGAVGFLRTDARRHTVLEVICRAADSGVPRGPAGPYSLTAAFAVTRPRLTPDPRVVTLTRRERDVLALVAKGLSNGEIASTLVVTTSTVKTHMNAILGKLGLRDRVQATVFAYESGLVRPGAGTTPA